ncbi:MAG: hypothetical protein ABJN40_04980 [Sneathiella sp.]
MASSRLTSAGLFLVGMAAAALISSPALSATTYSDRSAFESTLSSSFTDDYEDSAYQNPPPADLKFSDANTVVVTNNFMSSVANETKYRSTGFNNVNIISDITSPGNKYYCAGCNGSFILDFTSTSYGTSNGVFGVGMNYDLPKFSNIPLVPYFAHVTFGDDSTEVFTLPYSTIQPIFTTLFAITSDTLIKTIHFADLDGNALTDGSFLIDNLTIGSSTNISAVPLPAALPLYGAGIALMGFIGWRKRRAP